MVLEKVTCAVENEGNPSEKGINEIQLTFEGDETYDKYRSNLGKRVAVEGQLWHSYTGHHHTPLVLRVRGMEPAFELEQPNSKSAQRVTQYSSSLPADEVKFADIIKISGARYRDARNEFQKSSVRGERAQALAEFFHGGLSIAGWLGQVSIMKTTSDGNGVLSLKVPDSPGRLGTWSNGFSDLGSGTLIPHGSEIYNRIASLSVGETVSFSGTFVIGKSDFVSESSLTEDGSMTDPDFIFKFSSIHK